MRTSLTVGFDAEGVSTLLAGPEVPAPEQKAKFAGYIAGKLPKNIVRVELWVSDRGRAKKALCPKHSAAMAKEAQAQEAERQEEKAAALRKIQEAEAKKLEGKEKAPAPESKPAAKAKTAANAPKADGKQSAQEPKGPEPKDPQDENQPPA